MKRVVLVGTAVLALLWLTCSSYSQPPSYLDFEGTIKDAAGKPIAKGEVHFTFAGGKLGDFKKSFNNGEYGERVRIPANAVLPLMIKLTFYSDDSKIPPRWLEHLSPHVANNDKQRIHVVVYTDDQLRHADLSVLFSEAQQLEQSLFAWKRAKPEFKDRYGRFFSQELLDHRREIIYAAWREAAVKDNANWGPDIWYDRLSLKGPIAYELKRSLPR